MKNRGLTLVAHTHWDREWYEPFETFRAQLVEMLDEALDDLERDERLHFTLDGHVALVDDYLELRPENQERIRALVSGGRLHVGPWYTQADTLLVDGEGLIRNLAFGIRRAEQLGGAMRVGYMPDQFGHAAQMPQLLRMFGIDGAVLWRGVGPERPPHAFRWQAPDGSEVTALWLQDGYGSGRRIPSDPSGFVAAVERMLERLGDWSGDLPLLVPIGDDHVRLASWLPDVAAALPNARIGGYQHHLPQLPMLAHTIVGELRSPAFAPVLAGVASARIREKQAAHRATQSLLRYAEPLAAWVAAMGGAPRTHLIQRAWQLLFLNQAHDSAAGCGADVAHEDVQARYRWAEQIAAAARELSLARLHVEGEVAAYLPVAGAFVVEAEIPKSLATSETLVATGPDGIARPIQSLSTADEPPIFEGEFSAAELGQHLGGLDPKTPIFGKFITGLSARALGSGVVRLDVGLGEVSPPPGRLANDQKKLVGLLATTERFKVVLHSATPTRRVLIQSSGADNALVPIAVKAGVADDGPRAARVDARSITSGPITVSAEVDGTILIHDGKITVRANDLVDDGDRGDLYHFDAVGEPIRPHAARADVIEEGPVRARLRITQSLTIPSSLSSDRRRRGDERRELIAVTDVTLYAGERRVELSTTLNNDAQDHRLRALAHFPRRAERLDVEHGMVVIARPFDTAGALGGGTERAAPTGQHHQFVDLTDGHVGLALMSRGLPEHEAFREEDQTSIALTLVRSVGWLSRGDLSVIDHAAGPMLQTPGAQEQGPHHFEYSILLHEGDWRQGRVLQEARRYLAPAIGIHPRGRLSTPAAALVESNAVITAIHPAAIHAAAKGIVVRVLNTEGEREVTLRPAIRFESARIVNPLEEPIAESNHENGIVRLMLRPWQLATVLFQ